MTACYGPILELCGLQNSFCDSFEVKVGARSVGKIDDSFDAAEQFARISFDYCQVLLFHFDGCGQNNVFVVAAIVPNVNNSFDAESLNCKVNLLN